MSIRHRLLLPLLRLLLILAINPVVFGLMKLQPSENGPNLLVTPGSFAKPDWIYLYEINRTATCPSQAPKNLFIETALKLLKIPFHRIPNQFLLGSQSEGATPFVQFKGEYYDGVEKIIELITKGKNLDVKERKLIDFSMDVAFKILMRDRVTRHKSNVSYKSYNGGLDFMIKDEGIRQQLIANVPELMAHKGKQTLEVKFEIPLKEGAAAYWGAFFKVVDIDLVGMNEEKAQAIKEVQNYVKDLNTNNWRLFELLVGKFMREAWKKYLFSQNPMLELISRQKEKMNYFTKRYGTRKGTREEMIAAVSTTHQQQPMSQNGEQVLGAKFEIPVSRQDGAAAFWRAYYTTKGKTVPKIKSEAYKRLGKKYHIKSLNEENWREFEMLVDAFVDQQLEKMFVGPGGAEDKLNQLLQLNQLDGQEYAKYGEVEIYNKFREKLKMPLKSFAEHKGPFLFGQKPAIADAALFGILVQFFETPMNIPEFKCLFLGEGKLTEEEKEIINNRKGLKVLPEYKQNEKAVRDVLRKFVDSMKMHLGLMKKKPNTDPLDNTLGTWDALKNKSWPLNYEYLLQWDYNWEHRTKYDGPYNVETDDLDGLEKLLPDFFSNLKASFSPVVFREQKELPKNVLMEKIVQKISAFADDENTRKFMLTETAAYLCQLGHEKAQKDGEECRDKHEQSREWVKYNKKKRLELKYTRKLIYDTIVDFYDAQVAENVAEATLDVAVKIGAAMKAKDNVKVAEYSSALNIGNEN